MIAPAGPEIDFEQLKKSFSSAKSRKHLYEAVANAPFDQKAEMALLFLGFISFFLIDKTEQLLKLAAVSDTEEYEMSVRGYDFKPSDYKVLIKDQPDNDIVKAITTGQPQSSTTWEGVSRKHADPEQVEINQANSGIAYNVIHPLTNKRGALLFCFYQYEEHIGDNQHQFMRRYSDLVSQFVTG